MKKALLVTTVSGFVPQFEMNSVSLLQENGYEVHYATNYNHPFYGKDNTRLDGTGIIRHQIDFARSPYSRQTLIAYKQLDKLMSAVEFDVVHCHTPLGSILARLVAKKHHINTVIYTAHGFHFFKGTSKVNWLIYYTAEKLMARCTDAILTINQEDYQNASRFKLKPNGKVYYISGAGIDTKRFRDVDVSISEKRRELGISDDDFVVLSVGELNKNKNHEIVIRALSEVNHSGIVYLVCGNGEYKDNLKRIIEELHMEDYVKFLGYRSDIPEICYVSDVFAFPSFREGLPVSMMEAMSAGLPVVASKIRGTVDLIEDGMNGYLLDPDDAESWGKTILKMKVEIGIRQKMGQSNLNKMYAYDKAEIKLQLERIYREQFFARDCSEAMNRNERFFDGA